MNKKNILLLASLLLFSVISLKAMKDESPSDEENENGISFQEWMAQMWEKNRHSPIAEEQESDSSSSESDDENFDVLFGPILEQLSEREKLSESMINGTPHSKIAKEKKFKTSFLADWAFPLSITAGTAIYCASHPESIQESWEYIKNIPIPFPLASLCVASGYIAFRTIQHSRKNLKASANNLGSLFFAEKLEDFGTRHNMLALAFAVNKVEVNRNYKQLKKEQKKTKKKCKSLKEKIKLLEEEQEEKNSFVVNESKTTVSPQSEQYIED